MALKFENIRLHRNDSKKDLSFYWDIETGNKIEDEVVRELAGKEFFFTPEEQCTPGYMYLNAVLSIKFDKEPWISSKFWNVNNLEKCIKQVNGINYIPCSVLRLQFSDQYWKKLQCIVSTWIPENELKSI